MKIDNIRLNTHQKTVLAIIAASPTSVCAASDITKNPNLTTAATLLFNLGVIVFADNAAEITERGQQVSVEENITDESGALTTNGNVYLKMNAINSQPGAIEQSPVGESLLHQLLTIVLN